MVVFYSNQIYSTIEEHMGKKVRSFHAENPVKISNNFGEDIVVIEGVPENV